MTAIVLDASIVLAWLLRDSRADEADQLVAHALGGDAIAPRLMRLEVPNGLRNRLRRGQLSATERDMMIADFQNLPIEWDDEIDPEILTRLSDQTDTTIYDAAYLDCARRRALPLATLDQRLAQAAGALGVAVLP